MGPTGTWVGREDTRGSPRRRRGRATTPRWSTSSLSRSRRREEAGGGARTTKVGAERSEEEVKGFRRGRLCTRRRTASAPSVCVCAVNRIFPKKEETFRFLK